MSDDYTQAEIVRTLKRIEGKVDTLSANYLPRAEWNLWAKARENEIRDIKSSKAPWWTWAAVLVSIGAFLLNFVTATR